MSNEERKMAESHRFCRFHRCSRSFGVVVLSSETNSLRFEGKMESER